MDEVRVGMMYSQGLVLVQGFGLVGYPRQDSQLKFVMVSWRVGEWWPKSGNVFKVEESRFDVGLEGGSGRRDWSSEWRPVLHSCSGWADLSTSRSSPGSHSHMCLSFYNTNGRDDKLNG